VTDPLEVEVFASGLLGAWWQRLPLAEDAEMVFGTGTVEYAARAGTPAALALLRALAVPGVRAEQREAASAAAAALAAKGVAEPPWAAEIGRVRVGECWRLADVYGDQASLLVVFGYGRRRHGLLALVDFNHLGGWVKDAFVTGEPGATLRELRKAALSEPLATLERVDPAEARRLLEDGLSATDATWQPEVSQELRQFRALVLARCRAMPAPEGAGETEREVGEPEREAIVAEFLASPHARGLPDAETAGFCARLLVDFSADYDDGRPLRVSPAKVEGFLHDWVPAKVMLDEADLQAMPAVVATWVRWAGERTGLPDVALAELVGVAGECGEHFAEVYQEAADASPLRLFLQGLDTSGGLASVQDAVDRRMFAMPFFGTRIGDEDFPELDPGDADERRLLIEGEHPEYHDALRDPAFDGEVDGVNPRLHLAIHEVVANQLWDNDPPEAWHAAKRLRDAGRDRHDILHELGGIVTTHLHGVLTGGAPVDTEAYRRSLEALARPARRQTRKGTGSTQPGTSPRGAPSPTKDAVYQVKVSLRGVRPPIWRRLRLPATTTSPGCTTRSRRRSAGATPTCTPSRRAVAATRAPRSASTTSRPGSLTSARCCRAKSPVAWVPGCATPTTSATPGSTTCWSRRSCPPTACTTPSAWPAGARDRRRTAAASGATPTCSPSSPTPTIPSMRSGSPGWATSPTRPPSTRTRSTRHSPRSESHDHSGSPAHARQIRSSDAPGACRHGVASAWNHRDGAAGPRGAGQALVGGEQGTAQLLGERDVAGVIS
jgi:Domain of unknown function (DUF1841)